VLDAENAFGDQAGEETIGSIKSEVVFGTDNRQEIYTLGLEPQYESDSVALTINVDSVTDNGNGTSTLTTTPFNSVGPYEGASGSAGPLCSNEPFKGQPKYLFCTAFLVAPTLIATAGHCTGTIVGHRYVFGFVMDSANQPRTTVKTADVYAARRVVASVSNPGVEDWSIVELDRAVPNRRIVPMRRAGALGDDQSLTLFGHPQGLPMKYASGGVSKASAAPQYFGFTLDHNRGNSGGPIFNATTHEAEGIVSTTPGSDFVWNAAGACYKSNVCSSTTGCPGWAGAQRITTPAAWVTSYSSTYLANFNGSGGADLISVTWSGLWTRNSTGSAFQTGNYALSTGFYGNQGTFFADINNDGRADAIAVNQAGISVRKSDGTAFGAVETWAASGFWGDHGTFLADINNDHRADAIAVNYDGITIRRAPASGTGFGSNESWTSGGFFGNLGTYFADINADGRADAIALNDGGITVRRAPASGVGFLANETWTSGPYFGDKGIFFVDVTGDGKADAVAVNSSGITVRRASAASTSFLSNETWTTDSYYGTRSTLFADVNADGRADAVAINDDGAYVRLSNGSAFSSPAVKWVTFTAGNPSFGTVGVYQTSL
jgi:hypothetical protein